MNSVIEAQQEFTDSFGELRLSHLMQRNLELPYFTNEYVEFQNFLDTHRQIAPIKLTVTETRYLDAIVYNEGHEYR